MEEGLEKVLENFTHLHPDRLSSHEFNRMEELRSLLIGITFQNYGSEADSVNDSLQNYINIISITNKFSELHRFFPKIIEHLRRYEKDFIDYIAEHDRAMFQNITEAYNGKRNLLVTVGASHLEYPSLTRLINEANIPFVKFINHDLPAELIKIDA